MSKGVPNVMMKKDGDGGYAWQRAKRKSNLEKGKRGERREGELGTGEISLLNAPERREGG